LISRENSGKLKEREFKQIRRKIYHFDISRELSSYLYKLLLQLRRESMQLGEYMFL
jgi:hypothetical protein